MAGQELVARLQELSSLNATCGSCGALLGSLQHFMACGAAAPLVQPQIRIDPNCNGTIFCHSAHPAESTPRGRYIAQFKALTNEMVALTTRKNADYAGESDPYANFREFGTLGFLVRMSDKWQRIKTLTESGKTASVKDETVEDTLLDLATYSLLLITWLRAQRAL